jgi:hypothetical protein
MDPTITIDGDLVAETASTAQARHDAERLRMAKRNG